MDQSEVSKRRVDISNWYIMGFQLVNTTKIPTAVDSKRTGFLQTLAPYYADACKDSNGDLFVDAFYPLYLKRFSNVEQDELPEEVFFFYFV